MYSIFDRGECKIMQKGPLVGSAWRDNRVVTALSTTSQPIATDTVLRRQKDGSRIPVTCPESIIIYNKHMGGVDRGDQLRGYYSKSRKFYKYVYYFLFFFIIFFFFFLGRVFFFKIFFLYFYFFSIVNTKRRLFKSYYLTYLTCTASTTPEHSLYLY